MMLEAEESQWDPKKDRPISGYAQRSLKPNPDFWRGRVVVVTGGTGFLGWHLVQLLRHLGARVRIFALHPPLHHPLLKLRDLEPIFGDIRDGQLLQSVLQGSSVVLHAAGPVEVTSRDATTTLESHVIGTAQVLKYSPSNARIVHTSSVTTIGASKNPLPLDEEHVFNLERLTLPYIQAKRAAEQLVLEAAKQGRWACVVNPGYLVGPEDFGPSIMGRFCRRFWMGRIWLVPRGGICVADVRDVAQGHILAAEHGRPGQRYILGGYNLSFLDFCQLLAKVAGMRPRLLRTCPTPLLTLLALAAHARAWWKSREPYPSLGHVRMGRYYWYYSSQRAMEELGYSVRNVAETIRDTWEWYSKECRPRWRKLQRWWLRLAA